MSHQNLFCDQCGHEATVFALQPPLKVKACAEHSVHLIAKYSTAYSIVAYDFIERAEDIAEYEERREIVSKCRGTITTLQERCEENRNQAHSRLQSAMVAMLAIVERGISEQHMRVEQRWQQVNEELNALNAHLEKYAFDKSFALDPALEALQFTPSGALFKVVIGDCSLLLVKAVLDNCVLLPVDEGMPRMDSGEKLIAKAGAVTQTDLAAEMLVYTAELGFQDFSSDYRKVASKMKRKTAKKLCFELPLTLTEERLREVAELYQQAGKQAKEEGDYIKALKKLERGWGWLQQWGVESPEMCLQLSMVLAHFGRTDEACEMLRQSLQHTSSAEMSLKLSNCLVEVYYISGREKAAAEIAEEGLNSGANCSNAFEQLKALYFLAKSYYKLDKVDRGMELVDHWTNQIAADTEESKCVLKCIYAEKQYREERYEEAGRLYEDSYLAVYARYKLAFIYESLELYEAATTNFLQAADIYSTHFPHSHIYIKCLLLLARHYKSRQMQEKAEAAYLQAIALCAANFPLSRTYAKCLYYQAKLYQSMKMLETAETIFLQAFEIYSTRFPDAERNADCLADLANLYNSLLMPEKAEATYLQALGIYSARFPGSKNCASCYYELAELHKSMQQFETSEANFLLALDIYSTSFPHTKTYANCLLDLAKLYKLMHRQENAERTYLHAIDIYSAYFPQCKNYAKCLENLAKMYGSMLMHDTAEAVFLRAVEVYSTYFPHTEHYADCLFSFAKLHASQKLHEQAEITFLQAIDIYSAYFPCSHRYVKCLHSLALMYKSMQLQEKEERTYLQAIAIYSNYFPRSQSYANCLYNFADLASKQGRVDEAIQAFEAALQVCIEIDDQKVLARVQSKLQKLHSNAN